MDEISNSTSSSSSKSAEQVVRAVAIRIGMVKDTNSGTFMEQVDTICQNMKKEFVVEDWQLSTLDSSQWKDLGAPIGLAAAVRKVTVSLDVAPTTPDKPIMAPMEAPGGATRESLPSAIRVASSPSQPQQEASQQSSSMMGGIVTRMLTSVPTKTKTSKQSATNETVLDEESPTRLSLQPRQEADKPTRRPSIANSPDAKCTHGNASAETQQQQQQHQQQQQQQQPPTSLFSLARAFSQYKRTQSLFTTFVTQRPFPLTSHFQRALIHCKSGADLKAHALFVMELNVVAAALFFGAGVELWGAFPQDMVLAAGTDSVNSISSDDDDIPHVPKNLALVYHFASFLIVGMHLITAVAWIWGIHVAAAVHVDKFTEFFHHCRYAYERMLHFSEFAMIVVVLNVSMLLSANVAATTTNQIMRCFGYALPIVILSFWCRVAHTLASYIGRVAYHGFFLMNHDPSKVTLPTTTKKVNRMNGESADADNNNGNNSDSDEVYPDGPEKAEVEMTKRFYRDRILSETNVLRTYRKATACWVDCGSCETTAPKNNHSSHSGNKSQIDDILDSVLLSERGHAMEDKDSPATKEEVRTTNNDNNGSARNDDASTESPRSRSVLRPSL